MDWIKKHAADTLLVLVSCAFALVLADMALYVSPVRHVVVPSHAPKGYLQFDDHIGYVISPNFPTTTLRFADASFPVWSNSLGCFDSEYGKEQPYIYLMGDSFAWGWTPLEQKWGKELERELGLRVLTCGTDGYGTRQELLRARGHLEKLPKPALIVVSYLGANDVDDDTLFPNHTVYRGYPVRSEVSCLDATCTVPVPEVRAMKDIKLWLSTHSVLYILLQREVYAPLLAALRADVSSVQGSEPSALPPVHTDAIRGFAALAKEKNAQLIVVLIPSKEDVREGGAYSNARMKAFLEQERITYLDLLPVMQKNEALPDHPLYWEHDGHWNPQGNRIAGAALAEYLRSTGTLKQ